MVLDLIALEDTSRVWLYQADRELSYDELDFIREKLFYFLRQWTSHNMELCVYGNVFHRRFIGLFVDDSKATGPSGCSIDKSVHFVRELGQALNVDFFNRLLFAYFEEDEQIKVVSKEEFEGLYTSNTINEDTLVFDNLVKTKGEFLTSWIRPIKETWHKNMLGI